MIREQTGGKNEKICTRGRERTLWRVALKKLEIIPPGLSSRKSTLRDMAEEVSRRQEA